MLEITESLLLRDTAITIDVLRQLREMGVRLAIDDFGTGYSSLTYLRHFPIDTLKIDKSFVDEIASPRGSALVRATVQFGQTMDLTTIAEGIEAPDQLRQLRDSGCHLGQGYFFAKPLEPTEIESLLGIY
jgi:EAL domain-containing protein (putative c-di-GMP-specific phosphodiesterase class I)